MMDRMPTQTMSLPNSALPTQRPHSLTAHESPSPARLPPVPPPPTMSNGGEKLIQSMPSEKARFDSEALEPPVRPHIAMNCT